MKTNILQELKELVAVLEMSAKLGPSAEVDKGHLFVKGSPLEMPEECDVSLGENGVYTLWMKFKDGHTETVKYTIYFNLQESTETNGTSTS